MTETHDTEIVHRELDIDREEPAIAIVEVVATLEGTPAIELPPVYNSIDGMLSNLFSNPPAPESQITVEFTYSSYRVTVKQSGAAEFVHVT